MGFRITTWNVNGIRNPFGYQPWRAQRKFQAMFEILEADIVIMQETKIQLKDLRDDMVLVPGWDVFFSLPRHKKGYSGVAIYTRNDTCAPIRAEEGITGVLCPPKSTTQYRDLAQSQQIGGYPRQGQLSGSVDEFTLDSEGRCVILEFPAFILLGVYCPANRDESRKIFRMAFLEALDVRIRNLVADGKEVILTGDLNIVRSEIDSTNVFETLRKEEMTMDEWLSVPSRRLFNQLVFDGEVHGPRDESRQIPVLWDLCRHFHPTREGMNTCWDTKRNTRPANNGSRIDYILCSNGLKDWFTHANIQEGLMGSDHCPVFGTMADTIVTSPGDKSIKLLDIMNPPGMFHDGKRVQNWDSKDILPLSAKLIPEFDRRRNIRDMFTKTAAGSLALSTNSIAGATDNTIISSDLEFNTKCLPDSTGVFITKLGVQNKTTYATEVNNCKAYFAEADSASGPADQLLIGKPTSTNEAPKKRVAEALVAIPPGKRSRDVVRNDVSGIDDNTRIAETAETCFLVSGVAPVNGGGVRGQAKPTKRKSQQTLQGFFKPLTLTTSAGNPATTSSTPSKPLPPSAITNNIQLPTVPRIPSSLLSDTFIQQTSGSRDQQTSRGEDVVFDPIEAKESWSKLLSGRRVLPRCESHNEPCISLVTKKPGINCGRSFYICPRPLGPSGEKEKASEWRCGTFIWSSDWS